MITIVSGTNRKDSLTKKISLIYRNFLKSRNQNAHLIDLADLPDDFLVSALYENEGKNEAFNPIRDQVTGCDKFLFVTPEYNGSFPGVLKVFLDGLKYPDAFRGKKCAILGISAGVQGGELAMSHLTDIFNYLGMSVLANKPRLREIDQYMNGPDLISEDYMKLLEEQADQLIQF